MSSAKLGLVPASAEAESLIFEAVYTPVTLEQLLSSAGTRGRIRRLPAVQLYYSIQGAEDADLLQLLPHVTEQQWATLLALDLWQRDETSGSQLLGWVRLLAEVDPAVARKLLRATDEELWELLFREELEIFGRTEEDEFEGEPAEGRSWMQTPDGQFLLVLPEQPEKERLLRRLIDRLSELDSNLLSYYLAESRVRTSLELKETAYQQRRRRLEELGFQDYFEAVEIFSYWPADEPLPARTPHRATAVSSLSLSLTVTSQTPLLLLDALTHLDPPLEQQALEELFYSCNKLMAARQISAADQEGVRRGIREAILGINLGLDCWCNSDPARAIQGLQDHFVVSFYHFGASRIRDLQSEIEQLIEVQVPAGSPLEALIEGVNRTPPVLTELVNGRLVEREFVTARDLEIARQQVERAIRNDEGRWD